MEMIALFVIIVLLVLGGMFHATIGTFIVGIPLWLGVMFGAALIVGSPFFWLILLFESGVMFWSLDDDDDIAFGTAIASLIILLLLFQFASPSKPLTYLWQHLWLTVAGIAGYFVIGAAWSVAKWWFAETNRRNKAKEDFLDYHKIKGNTIPNEFRAQWGVRVGNLKSNPRKYKARFLAWIAYWPWSLVWTILNDPLKRAARRIYSELLSTYQRITDHVWSEEA